MCRRWMIVALSHCIAVSTYRTSFEKCVADNEWTGKNMRFYQNSRSDEVVTLKPMNQEEFQQYISYAIEDYAKDKVTSGNWSEDEAIDLSKKAFARLLPKDEKSEFNYLFSIFHDQHLVGMIWIAQKSPTNKDEGFIYDFIIFEQYQGLGYGKKAMKETEMIAKELGMKKMGLHVFGHNKIARGLYEKLGYEITNITMEKIF